MIIVLLALLSLCAISFTYLLHEKKLKVGAIAVTSLYAVIVLWTYFLFIVDVANFGFKDTRLSELVGSPVFHSFTDLCDSMSVMPESLHFATAIVAVLVAVIVILELIVCSIRVYNAIVAYCKKEAGLNGHKFRLSEIVPKITWACSRIFILHCRLNN